MPSPDTIITNALKWLGVTGSGQTAPAPEDTDLGLSHYNRIVEDLAARQLGWYDANEAFAFGVSQQSYSIAPSGTAPGAGIFVMTAGGVRPPKFDRAKMVLTSVSPNQEYDLPILTVQTYSALPNPAQSALIPLRVYYQPTFPLGTLWPVPFPTVTSNLLRLFWRNQLSTVAIADITTNIDMPSGIESALTWELLRRCAAGGFNKPLTDDQKQLANDSWQVLLTLKNADPALISTDIRGATYGRNNFNPNTLRPYY